ncbi:nucleotide exchange factor GrpE, partial [Candidatus Woesearchaeota archaeon]
YRKRKEAEMVQWREFALKDFVAKLLPVLDSFELALRAESTKNLKQGIEIIYSQLMDILRGEGLEEIKENKKFDSTLHEAILTEKANKPSGTILEVFQKGYKFKGKVLRAAKVKVAK